jgi:hypothetical protein
MEFLVSNYINTTTAVSVNNGTLTVDNLFKRDTVFQFVSDGDNSDSTITSLTVNFDSTLSVSRIAILGMNAKSFNIFYNGVTANTFAITSTSATTTSQWSTNSETSMYLRTTAVDCTSVTFDFKTTTTADSEKAVGYLALTAPHVVFPRIPTAKNWKPKFNPKQIVHKMSDGGTRVHTIKTKFNTKIKFKYITESFRDSLKTVWDINNSFMFSAFGTSTAWDEIFYEVVWPGKFDFYEYTQDSKTENFSGSITLNEVSD